MKILGIDTATRFLCVAVHDGAKTASLTLDAGKRHSAILIPTIQRVLDAAGLKPGDIDYFAGGTGPGSFTGIRVGMSAAKGFAWSLRKPVVGISTLDTIAHNALLSLRSLQQKATIVAALDAKRGHIYCSAYRFKGGTLKRVSPYRLLSLEDFLKKIPAKSIILGDAAALYKEAILRSGKNATVLDKDFWYPKAHTLIRLAQEKIASKKISSSFDIKPLYLYPKECQITKGIMGTHT